MVYFLNPEQLDSLIAHLEQRLVLAIIAGDRHNVLRLRYLLHRAHMLLIIR